MGSSSSSSSIRRALAVKLGEGVSGCVYASDVPCKSSAPASVPVVSKVGGARIIDHEAEVLQRMKQFDPDGRYHLQLIKAPCEIEAARNCNVTEKDADEPWKRMVLRRGARTLKQVAQSPFGVDFKLRTNIPHIVDAIRLMERARIRYADLHSQNIMTDPEDGLWRITDFGEARLCETEEEARQGRKFLRSDLSRLLTGIWAKNKQDVDWARNYIGAELPDDVLDDGVSR
jgi:hypothetical protein